jgi:hypothetical protein
MSRASQLLKWFLEQDDNDEMEDEEEEDKPLKPGQMKVKQFIKKEKDDAETRGEETEDDPNVIDADDDDMRKSAKVAHFMDRTSGTTKEGKIKNYAFPVKRVKRNEE